MVCIPCVAVPILLIIWRFLIQPIILKWWQYRNSGKPTANKNEGNPPELVKECKNGICNLSWKTDKNAIKDD